MEKSKETKRRINLVPAVSTLRNGHLRVMAGENVNDVADEMVNEHPILMSIIYFMADFIKQWTNDDIDRLIDAICKIIDERYL